MNNVPFPKYVGEQIRAVRSRYNVSQRELAGLAGVSVSFLSEVENGKRSVSLRNAYNIAKALGVPPSALVPR